MDAFSFCVFSSSEYVSEQHDVRTSLSYKRCVLLLLYNFEVLLSLSGLNFVEILNCSYDDISLFFVVVIIS